MDENFAVGYIKPHKLPSLDLFKDLTKQIEDQQKIIDFQNFLILRLESDKKNIITLLKKLIDTVDNETQT